MNPFERIISADDHVLETPQTWIDRMPASKWGDRIPHLVQEGENAAWLIDGKTFPVWWRADLPPAASDPAARLALMDGEGIQTSILYPLVAGVAGERFGALNDLELQLACVQAYNDWLIEVWASASERFIPQCILPLASGAIMAKEVRRAASRGHRGVIVPSVPSLVREDAAHINEPVYEPLWEACEELGLPICFHAGASDRLRLRPYAGYNAAIREAFAATTLPQSEIVGLANLLLSHILDRHPKLKVIFSGAAAGWTNFMLEAIDYNFSVASTARLGYDRKPSEIFREQCSVVWTVGDAASLQHAAAWPGEQSLLWGCEFPLPLSTWPRSRDYVENSFAGLPQPARNAILAENAAELYKIKTLTKQTT